MFRTFKKLLIETADTADTQALIQWYQARVFPGTAHGGEAVEVVDGVDAVGTDDEYEAIAGKLREVKLDDPQPQGGCDPDDQTDDEVGDGTDGEADGNGVCSSL